MSALLLVTACGGLGLQPRNELEAILQGSVPDVIANLELYIEDNKRNGTALEAKLLGAGFQKGQFVERPVEEGTTRLNCQFYYYRRDVGLISTASAVVWLCDEGSGANFGYIAP